MESIHLSDRAVIALEGPEARPFLQGLGDRLAGRVIEEDVRFHPDARACGAYVAEKRLDQRRRFDKDGQFLLGHDHRG